MSPDIHRFISQAAAFHIKLTLKLRQHQAKISPAEVIALSPAKAPTPAPSDSIRDAAAQLMSELKPGTSMKYVFADTSAAFGSRSPGALSPPGVVGTAAHLPQPPDDANKTKKQKEFIEDAEDAMDMI